MFKPLFATAGMFLSFASCGAETGDPNPPAPPPPPPAATSFADVSATNLPAVVRGGGRHMEARAADFDSDGDLDLLIAREFDTNLLLLNDGDGRFTETSDRLPKAVHDHEDIAVADLDGDSDLDVVVASEDDQAKELYLNDGHASFTDASIRLPQQCQSNAVVAGDIDQDGDKDLIFGCGGPELLLLNDGRANFTDESSQRIPARSDITQDVALGDVDRDGDLDLLVGNENGNLLLLNDGQGFFTAPPVGFLPLRSSEEETRNADFGDIDGDGDLDIFFANTGWKPTNDPQDRLLRNDGAGQFTDVTSTALPLDQETTLDGDFVDIDGDGDLDLLTAHFPNRPYRVFLNDGSGRYSDATASWYPNGTVGSGVEVEAADFNRDGRIDVYLTGFNGPDRLLLRER